MIEANYVKSRYNICTFAPFLYFLLYLDSRRQSMKLFHFRLLFLATTLIFLNACDRKVTKNNVLTSPEIKQMISLIDSQIDKSSVHAITDSARRIIQKHTQHSDQFSYCDDISCVKDMANAISAHIKNNAQEPKMLCSHRTLMQRIILEHYGLETRGVNLVNKGNQGHVFLEVKNGNKWEIVDPDYNIYYKKLATNERMSLKQLIKKDFKDFVPCSEKGCSWKIAHSKDVPPPVALKADEYYGVGYIQGEVLYVHSEKFNSAIDEAWLKEISDADNFYFFIPAS